MTQDESGARALRGSTRQRIVAMATSLFHQQGYNATTLRQVADGVGIQVGSLYNHMVSKEALLLDIAVDAATELVHRTERALARAGHDPVERVRVFLDASIRCYGRDPRAMFVSDTELRGLSPANRRTVTELRDRHERLLAEALQQAVDAERMVVPDRELAVYAAMSLCRAVPTWFESEPGRDIDDLVEALPRLYAPLATAVVAPV